MAEVQKQNSANAAENTQLFLQFVSMMAQQIVFSLGIGPGGRPVGRASAETAKILIDQMNMIKSKTAGNLNKTEAELLDDAIKQVTLAFTKVVGTPPSLIPTRSRPAPAMPEDVLDEQLDEDENLNNLADMLEERPRDRAPEMPDAPASKPATPEPVAEKKVKPANAANRDDNDKRRFFKSYG